MKKTISLLLMGIFLSSNFSFAAGETGCIQDGCDAGYTCNQETKECEKTEETSTTTATTNNTTTNTTNQGQCPGSPGCPGYEETTNDISTTDTSTSAMGITCNEDELTNGQCKLNIYDTLGIRKSVRDEGDPTSVGLFVQDIVLSATFFIGTLVTIALVVSGLMFIFAASSGKDPANAKKGITGSLIGLLLVVSSYVIIRLVQYIAKGF